MSFIQFFSPFLPLTSPSSSSSCVRLFLVVQIILLVVVPTLLTLATTAQGSQHEGVYEPMILLGQQQPRQQRLLSPEDVIVGTFTREDLERMFRLERGTLITFRDGDDFDAIAASNQWTPYTGMALKKTRTEVYNGAPFPNGNQLLSYNPDGKSYVSIFLDETQLDGEGNPTEEQGGTIRVLGYSGTGIRLVCSAYGREIVPDPIPLEDFETYCFPGYNIGLTKIDDASCSYVVDKSDDDDEVFGYQGEGVKDPCGVFSPEGIAAIENQYNMTFGCNGELNGAINNFLDTLNYFAFKNVDVFTAVREDNGEEWDPFIVDNRDALFERGKVGPKCSTDDGKKVPKSKRKSRKGTKKRQ